MAPKATRLSAPDFARLIHRHNLDEAGVREQGIIVPKAFAADVVCAADDEEKRVSEWVMSTATPDRRGDTIQVKGWQLANFRKGGSILFAHDGRSLPVGRPLKVWKDTEALRLRMEHAPAEANPVAEQVFQLVKGKFLRGSSVGFIPLKWEFINDEEPWADGINFLKQELVEHSLVPVPQNPEALLVAVGKGLDVDMRLFTDWQRMALDGEVPSLGAHQDDIAASLKALTGNPVSLAVPVDLTPRLRSVARRVARDAAELADELSLHGAGVENDRLPDGYREQLLALTGAAQGVANLDDATKSSESVGGAASVAAASTGPAPSIDTLTLEQVASVCRAMGVPGDDAELETGITGAIKALAAPATEKGAETMDITKQIDALAQAARDGDADALEKLRALAEQVNCAAASLAPIDPEDVSVFELDDDPEERAANEGDDDIIEISGADLKAEIAKAVAQQMLAQTGRI